MWWQQTSNYLEVLQTPFLSVGELSQIPLKASAHIKRSTKDLCRGMVYSYVTQPDLQRSSALQNLALLCKVIAFEKMV